MLQGRRDIILGLFFVLVWPTFNLLFVSLVLLELGYLDDGALGGVALRIYPVFFLAYGVVLLLQRLFPVSLSEEKFWPQLALHIVAIFFASQFSGPILEQTRMVNLPQPAVIPLAFILFQITLFVAAKTLIIQREHHLATQLNLRQSQVNVLRSQSNPHFLFNTLNLLASEINRDPATAREIVYDLSDLLRESMKAAEQEFISLDEEVRLATLYLTLQQKRFPERLQFDVDVDGTCRKLPVPSLLLQPVVENVVKHVVAHSSEMTSLRLWAHRRDDSLLIGVQDNGPRIDTSTLTPRGGLRIVQETLALHYNGRANMLFESTGDGSRLTISLPLQYPLPGE